MSRQALVLVWTFWFAVDLMKVNLEKSSIPMGARTPKKDPQSAGMDRHIAKPFKADELLAAIETVGAESLHVQIADRSETTGLSSQTRSCTSILILGHTSAIRAKASFCSSSGSNTAAERKG